MNALFHIRSLALHEMGMRSSHTTQPRERTSLRTSCCHKRLHRLRSKPDDKVDFSRSQPGALYKMSAPCSTRTYDDDFTIYVWHRHGQDKLFEIANGHFPSKQYGDVANPAKPSVGPGARTSRGLGKREQWHAAESAFGSA
jgi:hypothetical protein